MFETFQFLPTRKVVILQLLNKRFYSVIVPNYFLDLPVDPYKIKSIHFTSMDQKKLYQMTLFGDLTSLESLSGINLSEQSQSGQFFV